MDKREIIIQNASFLFATEGFGDTKISKIAELSEIASGTVYLYFKNKEQILNEIFLRAWSKIYDILVDSMQIDGNNTEKFECFLDKLFYLTIENPNVTKLILREYKYWANDINHLLKYQVIKSKEKIADLLKDYFSNADIDLMAIVEYIIGSIWFYMSYELTNTDKDLLSEKLKNLKYLLINGLSYFQHPEKK